jgi:nitroreductase
MSDSVLAECVGLAVLAPSLHNSQPWRFRIRDGGVDVFADPDRQLHALDPDGRELAISVGAALFTLRLAVRRRGRIPCVDLFPDPAEPDFVARVTLGRTAMITPVVQALADAVPLRHTNRWPFAPAVVPADALEELTEAARHEGAVLEVAGAVSRNAILALSAAAERSLRSQGAYRAELSHWTSRRPGRRDGIPPSAIGPWDALERMPLRDFGLLVPRVVRSAERFEPFPTIVLLSTHGDTRREWITAGQALQRVLLVATRLRLATTPISQPVEIPAIRELLIDTGTGRRAQMVLRIGHGPPAAATPRRPLSDVLRP